MNPQYDVENILARAIPEVAANEAHRAALKSELLEVFRTHKARAASPALLRLKRWLTAGMVFAGTLLLASQLPAQYVVTIGTRVTFVSRTSENDLPAGPALRAKVQALLPTNRVHLWALRDLTGMTTVYLDCLDEGAQALVLARRLQQEFPGLQRAQLSTHPLEVNRKGTLLDKLGHKLRFRPVPAVLEQERQTYWERTR